MEKQEELYLTNLISVEMLQKVQDSFSRMTGMAALTTDADGVPVTQGSNFSDFCMKYTRQSKLGNERCMKCDRYGARATHRDGKSATYYCHAGLMDFAAPILADGELIGCFIGGQVLPDPIEEKLVREIAGELEIDPDEYWEAARKISVLNKTQIDNAADFLYTMASVLSDMAYGKYMAIQAGKEIEHAARMKSDFLANMSHEIRTPMNAVIGMAEIALRDNLPENTRGYLNQIKSSGKALLSIINDILDFSKIESGKMNISVAEYEPLSLFHDVISIIMTRLDNRDVELILDMNPGMPHILLGDSSRIRQVLINLANNAVKFTNKGRVKVSVDYEYQSEREVLLKVSVEDTGIGIKKQDMDKLFVSFQQVDSKRNRNIEGTGLGLAISQHLIDLMGGTIQVESEYGVGSCFSFALPQKVVETEESISVKNRGGVIMVGMFRNNYVKEQFIRDCERLDIDHRCIIFSNIDFISDELADILASYPERDIYFLIEQVCFTQAVQEMIKEYPQIINVLVTDFFTRSEYNLPKLLIVKKPLSALSIAMLLNHEEMQALDYSGAEINFDFVAPEADVLIVDDNAVNLTVVEGLLESLHMRIDTALNGKDAIEMISNKHYDLIFMDHMMPDMDGVETTRVIRRLFPQYHDVPILALTANVAGDVKKVFLQEGMNDFIAKPIELRIIVSKVKQWLPVEKIRKVGTWKETAQKLEIPDIRVSDLDTAFAIKMLGSEKLFWTVLKDYYRVIEKKAEEIRYYEEIGDIPAYTIEVHALKSASKQIGAIELSEKAAAMERAGNAREIELIHRKTPEMLEQYLAYLPELEPYFKEEEPAGDKKLIDSQSLIDLLDRLRKSVSDLDIDGMEAVIRDMDVFRYEEKQQALFERLKEAVENIDVDACEKIIVQMWLDV